MLEKPDLEDEKIIACLENAFGLVVSELSFLPLGADRNTAVYRAASTDRQSYFVKLRSGLFEELSVEVPKLLHEQGVQQVIAPLATRTGALWADLEGYHALLSPYVEGQNGWTVALTDAQWVEFGRALNGLHNAYIPAAVLSRVQREQFSPRWRERVREFQRQIDATRFSDPIAEELAAFLRVHRDTVIDLVNRAERLAVEVKAKPSPAILCHADMHVGNLLLEPDGTLHIVDWDTLLLAPKERDLMFIGGGLGGGYQTPEDEVRLFYEGYGPVEIDRATLAYYRYERIVQDIVAYCEDVLLTEGREIDRAQGVRLLTGQFNPGEVIDLAYRTEGLTYQKKA